MDAAQWPQQVATLPKQMEEITSPTQSNNNPNNLTNSRVSTPLQLQQQQQPSLERRTRPLKDQTINCPRCNSTNTKFCYYNNYSLTQPRYFCKTCRRYWTQGGTLRSVPVGGGSRKNKRSSSSTPLTPSLSSTNTTLPPSHTKLIIPDLNPPTSLSHLLNTSSQNPNIKFLEGHDLNLAFPIQGLFHHQFPKIEGNHNNINNNIENHEQQQQQININSNNNNNNNSLCPTTTTTTTTSTQYSALDLLRTGMASRGNLNPFFPISVSDPNTLYPSGYPNLHEFKPSMNFFSPPSEQNHNNNNSHNNNNNNNNNNMVGPNDHNNNNNNVGGGARLLFPFADMNKLATNNNTQQQQQNDDHIHDHDDQSKGNNGNDQQHHNNHHGYWGGMLDGGTW